MCTWSSQLSLGYVTFLCDDPLPTHNIFKVGQELQERKKTELERLFMAIDNYMT